MKQIRKLVVALLCLLMVTGISKETLATTVEGPIEVEWTNLHIDPTGYLSWTMVQTEASLGNEVRYYTIYLDIQANGTWRENYRQIRAEETDREITYNLVGRYKFRVEATFVSGVKSTVSQDSDCCDVTEEYVTKTGSSGGSSTGPGTTGPGTTGTTAVGPGVSSDNDIPAWVEKFGTWNNYGGNWYYINNGEVYKNKWACIYNPYAKTGLGQKPYDWFSFDETGLMRTGWYTDNAGLTFYLNPVSDGTKGKMVTGWQQIDGYTYYFNETEGTGYRGVLAKSTTIGGRTVDAQGRLIR